MSIIEEERQLLISSGYYTKSQVDKFTNREVSFKCQYLIFDFDKKTKKVCVSVPKEGIPNVKFADQILSELISGGSFEQAASDFIDLTTRPTPPRLITGDPPDAMLGGAKLMKFYQKCGKYIKSAVKYLKTSL